MLRFNILALLGFSCMAIGCNDFEQGLADALAHQHNHHGPPPAQTCDASTNILASGSWRSTDDIETLWLGSTGSSCGVNGPVYAASDSGLDQKPGTADDSLSLPKAVAEGREQRRSPCNTETGRCCISGTTQLWPLKDGDPDYTASVWGSVLTVALNVSPENQLLPYDGPARGFNIELSGLAYQSVKIAYRAAQDNPYSPSTYGEIGNNPVRFDDVECPVDWGDDWSSHCVVSKQPVALEVSVLGGDSAGPYELCVDRITPIL